MQAEQRHAVVEAAKGWLNTPYLTAARVRGPKGGADCATMIAGIYEDAMMLPKLKIEHYPHDWHLHRSEERYMNRVLEYAIEIPESDEAKLPGNLVLFRFGRCYAHGAIIIEWPVIIHAFLGNVCMYDNVETSNRLKTVGESGEHQGKPRARKFFTLKWGEQ